MAVLQTQLPSYADGRPQSLKDIVAYTPAEWSRYRDLQAAVCLLEELRESGFELEDPPAPDEPITPQVPDELAIMHERLKELKRTPPDRETWPQEFRFGISTLDIHVGSVSIKLAPASGNATLITDEELIWEGDAFADDWPRENVSAENVLREVPARWIRRRQGRPAVQIV